MINIEVKDNCVKAQVEGAISDILAETTVAVNAVYNCLLDDHPAFAELFRVSFVKCVTENQETVFCVQSNEKEQVQ